jgi:hypothetical protein
VCYSSTGRAALAALFLTAASCRDITDAPKAGQAGPGLLAVTPQSKEAPADAVTLVRIEATIDTSLKGDARRVKFATSAGLFGDKPDTEVRADESGLAVTFLRAPLEAGTAQVTASAGLTTLRSDVTFTTAFPERVDVDPSAFAVEAAPGKEITITATLRRTTGVPTLGRQVTFTSSVGRFSNAGPSNAAGVVVTRYTPGDTDYRGPVTITALTVGPSGSIISGSTTINIVAPK